MTDVRYRPLAARDKKAIAAYIALDLGSPHAAAKTIQTIDEAIETLKTTPFAGRPIDDARLENGPYRKAVASQYWIIYSIDEEGDCIIVERIMHQRRNLVPQMYYEIDFLE